MVANVVYGYQREVSKRLTHTEHILLFLCMNLVIHELIYSFIH